MLKIKDTIKKVNGKLDVQGTSNIWNIEKIQQLNLTEFKKVVDSWVSNKFLEKPSEDDIKAVYNELKNVKL